MVKNFIDVVTVNAVRMAIKTSSISQVKKTKVGCDIITSEGIVSTVEDYNSIFSQLNDSSNYIFEMKTNETILNC